MELMQQRREEQNITYSKPRQTDEMKIIQEIDVDKNIDIGSSIYQRDRYLSRRSANLREKNDK